MVLKNPDALLADIKEGGLFRRRDPFNSSQTRAITWCGFFIMETDMNYFNVPVFTLIFRQFGL